MCGKYADHVGDTRDGRSGSVVDILRELPTNQSVPSSTKELEKIGDVATKLLKLFSQS